MVFYSYFHQGQEEVGPVDQLRLQAVQPEVDQRQVEEGRAVQRQEEEVGTVEQRHKAVVHN